MFDLRSTLQFEHHSAVQLDINCYDLYSNIQKADHNILIKRLQETTGFCRNNAFGAEKINKLLCSFVITNDSHVFALFVISYAHSQFVCIKRLFTHSYKKHKCAESILLDTLCLTGQFTNILVVLSYLGYTFLRYMINENIIRMGLVRRTRQAKMRPISFYI